MAETKFYNDVSILDILTGTKRAISAYARNEELVQALQMNDYDKKFPEYFSWLKKKFYDEVNRERFRKTAAKILTNVFCFNGSFHPVIQKIVDYLQYKDLVFLNSYQ